MCYKPFGDDSLGIGMLLAVVLLCTVWRLGSYRSFGDESLGICDVSDVCATQDGLMRMLDYDKGLESQKEVYYLQTHLKLCYILNWKSLIILHLGKSCDLD